MMNFMFPRSIRDGANGSTWFVFSAEGGTLAALEGRTVAQRYWSSSRQARGFRFWRAAVKGGIAPAARTRSRLSLSLRDREEISRGLIAGFSIRKIAEQLGRSPSTISREINRNQGRQKYRATDADERAWRRALRPKSYLLADNRSLQTVVAKKLADHWSPQQVSGWLKVEYLDDMTMRVSHETIYKCLYIQARGV